MRRTVVIILLFSVLFFGGGVSFQDSLEAQYQSNVGTFCLRNSDCNTPMEFLVQSNCPFGSACVGHRCAVVCPVIRDYQTPEEGQPYPDVCEVDSDCDCSLRGERTIRCVCVGGGCYSVEAE